VSTAAATAPLPPALTPIAGVAHPVLKKGAAFDFSTVSASKVIVVDPASRRVVLAHRAAEPHPLASITKLMTAMLVLDHQVPFTLTHSITTADEVGGARLRVSDGTPLTVQQLFMTMLVGSANNAAHALSRSTGDGTDAFVREMNAKAKELGLSATRFVDPTGIEVENTSNAQDVAALLIAALDRYEIRKASSTARYRFVAEGSDRDIKNTNDLLVDDDNGLYVLGGKTGYLVESKWNLAVKMRDATHPPLIVVTLGSDDNTASFRDSARIAKWVWANATWTK
jgi:D-alanyl-D-alanine endopeptidase (penicillin-binding protein 7)